MTPELRIPDEVQALVGQANDSAQIIEHAPVTTPEEYQQADQMLRELKKLEKTLDSKRKWMLDPLAETTRRINDFFRAPLDRIKAAKTACDQAMVNFRLEQQRKAKEEERRQQEVVRQQQARLEAQAAKERAEAEGRAADLRRRAEEAAAAGKAGQAAKLQSQAEARLEAGHSTAAALQTAAESMPAPQVQANIPIIAGSHSRKSYKAREKKVSGVPHPIRQGEFLTPLEALVCAVAKGINDGTQYPPVSTLLANEKVLNQFATSLKEHFSFPGYELEVLESTVSRGR
jgi:hypothetical protein